MNNIKQILKYVDLFGEKCTFYVEKAPKLYSVTGGILSLLSITICIFVFLLTSIDDLQRISPSISISTIQPNEFHKIKFGKEKIWIPWRIRDYSNHFVNHTNLFYPFIYNYYSIKKNYGTGFEFKVRQLNYTLCNQTSFINKSDSFYIDSSLDELYCIEMDDIDVGGDWASEYISYIEFDLYLCKEGIDYDENNPYCTKYENISHYLGQNNSLMMSFYYPIVQFKANESINPMTIIYRERFYQISRYSNKIDRIFLQKNILRDDYGWLINKYNESSYWGLNKIQGDSYATGNKRDLMNEGSTSRVYSFNIYLEPSINTFFRNYKKIYIIFSECTPIIYIISFIFRMIANFCKFHTINKKFSEYLFIKIKDNSAVFDKKIKELKELNEKSLSNKKEDIAVSKTNNKKSAKHLKNYHEDKYKTFASHKNSLFFTKIQRHVSEKVKEKDVQKEQLMNDNSLDIINNNNQAKDNLSSKSNDVKENKNIGRQTIKTYFHISNKLEVPSPQNNDKTKKKGRKFSIVGDEHVKIQSIYKQFQKTDKSIIQNRKLFPSRYYFYIIFVKNLDILKRSSCFSNKFNKFSKSYMFMTRILDIFSYFDFFRQFNVFKTLYLSEKNLNIIEKERKINIGEISYMKNIKECLDNNNFRIFGRIRD